MRKLKYFGLLAVAFIIWIACGKQTPIQGPTGPQGPAGAPGGNLEVYPSQISTMTSLDFTGAGPYYFNSFAFPNYNRKLNYDVYAAVSKNHGKTWYKLPFYNIYQPGDDLFVTYGDDTLNFVYYNNAGAPSVEFPDSTLTFYYYIIPPQ